VSHAVVQSVAFDCFAIDGVLFSHSRWRTASLAKRRAFMNSMRTGRP